MLCLKNASGGNGKLICDIQGSTAYYALGDANKNITEYLDASGNLKAHYEYSPFGKVTAKTGTMHDDFDFRFSSEAFDSETSLVYYNYRYYNPDLGRWLSKDPTEEQGGYNLYAMVDNNPINFFDILGYWKWYGNWGGPGWAAGQNVNDGWNNSSSPNYVPGANQVNPVDDLDDCYREHDRCYESCRQQCPCLQSHCFSNCDYAATVCQVKALFGSNQWNGYFQAIPGAIALGGQGVVRDCYNATANGVNTAYNAIRNLF